MPRSDRVAANASRSSFGTVAPQLRWSSEVQKSLESIQFSQDDKDKMWGMVAAIIVYPLEVIKTILTAYPDEASGIGEAVEAVFKIGGGFKGLYAGLLPTLVAMFPYIGVEFMVYETNPNPNPNPNP